jgi:hypothetical protein
MRTRTKEKYEQLIAQIKEIMNPARRMYLTVFRIHSELNLKQTILHAIFKGNEYFQIISSHEIFFLLAHFAQSDEYEDVESRNSMEDHGWNSQKEHLIKLAIKWNCFDQATDLLEGLQYIHVSVAFCCQKQTRLIMYLETRTLGRTVQASSRGGPTIFH